MRVKWHKIEMNACALVGITHLFCQNVNPSDVGWVTDTSVATIPFSKKRSNTCRHYSTVCLQSPCMAELTRTFDISYLSRFYLGLLFP